jgi:hypothetical protein
VECFYRPEANYVVVNLNVNKYSAVNANYDFKIIFYTFRSVAFNP